jgi:hypothetical protein
VDITAHPFLEVLYVIPEIFHNFSQLFPMDARVDLLLILQFETISFIATYSSAFIAFPTSKIYKNVLFIYWLVSFLVSSSVRGLLIMSPFLSTGNYMY